MAVTRVNIGSVELDEPLDEAGFRHRATAIGDRLGARRIGAGVYLAEAGAPIWPYHYHHGIEEWLYVAAGEPVLRDPAGERVLRAGDLVCFPTGHAGAHTVKGPGRFVIFATGQHEEPWMSVYPDSDKISGPGGILLRTSAVGYWHGEGTTGSAPCEPRREPATSPQQPVANVLRSPAAPPGGGLLDATVAVLAPGEAAAEPYHYVYGRERWVLVLEGALTLRGPQGEQCLETADVVCLPEGPAGAHALRNGATAPGRALILTTTGFPANVCEPDTGRWRLLNEPGREPVVLSG